MTFQIETVPDAGPYEQELDDELRRMHELAVEAIYYTAIIENGSMADVETFLPDIRKNLAKIAGKVENAAHCAGTAIHVEGREVSA